MKAMVPTVLFALGGLASVLTPLSANALVFSSGATAEASLSALPQVVVVDGSATIPGGTDQASVTLGPVLALDRFGGVAFTAQATASADLRTGKIRTSGSITQASATSDAYVRSIGWLNDVLTFSLPQGMSSALVTFTLAVEGSTYGVVQSYCGVALYSDGLPGFQNNCALSGPQTVEWQISVLPGVQYQFSAAIQQFAYNRTPAGYDFLNTATVGYSLPTGVTFQSLSGVFLTGPSTDVPEPGTLALLGLGLAGLGRSRRRKA